MYQQPRGKPIMLRERTWAEIQQDDLEYECLYKLITCADEHLQDSPIAMAGEKLKKQRQFKGEVFQRMIKETYKAYSGKCKIPEVRFMIFDNGYCLMDVVNKKKYLSSGLE